MLVGAWHRRRDAAFGPFFGYAALLFAFSALVSAVHVPGGTFIHSAVALAPHGVRAGALGDRGRHGLGGAPPDAAGTPRAPPGCSWAAPSPSA